MSCQPSRWLAGRVRMPASASAQQEEPEIEIKFCRVLSSRISIQVFSTSPAPEASPVLQQRFVLILCGDLCGPSLVGWS
jgi:hypothetical protein